MKSAKFKDSPLGPIPEDWEVKRLGDVVALVTKGTTPTSIGCEFTRSGVTFIKAESIANNGSLISSMFAYISEQTHEVLRRSQLKENDILFSIAGVLGRVGIVGKEVLPANTNQALAIIRPKIDGEVDIKFLFYCLHAEYIVEAINQLQVGVAQANLSLENVEGLRLALPPLPEQQRIAEALGEVDKLIESLDEQIEKKRLIAKGVAHDLLSGAKRLPGFKGEWKRVTLDEIGVISKGSGISRTESNTGCIPAVRYGEIYTHHDKVVLNYVSHISEAVAQRAKPLKKGDVLFAASGETVEEIGKAVAIKDNGVFAGGDTIVFSPYEELPPIFLGHLLNSPYVQAQKSVAGHGATIVHIKPKDIGRLQVSLPALAEQQAIADSLGEQDAAIVALEAKREKYARIKEGMMRDMLTGKVRMKGE